MHSIEKLSTTFNNRGQYAALLPDLSNMFDYFKNQLIIAKFATAT